jgi:hypothetical protein
MFTPVDSGKVNNGKGIGSVTSGYGISVICYKKKGKTNQPELKLGL